MIDRCCEYCGKSFQSKRDRRCCNRSCAAKLSQRSKGRSAWTEQEEELIERLAGTMPICDIVKRVKSYQKRKNLEIRTDTAIKLKLKRLGQFRKCTLDNLTQYELSRSLGIKVDRVRNWTRYHDLPFRTIARNQRAIELSDVKSLAVLKPHLFAGIERDCLMWLLEDESLVDRCLQFELTGVSKPVKRLDTGEIYPSLKEAARRCYVTHHCISQAIARNGTSAGTKWEWVA